MRWLGVCAHEEGGNIILNRQTWQELTEKDSSKDLKQVKEEVMWNFGVGEDFQEEVTGSEKTLEQARVIIHFS